MVPQLKRPSAFHMQTFHHLYKQPFARDVGEGPLEHVALIFGDYNPQIKGAALGKGSCLIHFF